MKKTNAVMMRQNLGKVLKKLAASGRPVLVEKSRKTVAALISIEDYQKRFVDYEADIQREAIVKRILDAKIRLPKGKSSLELIREIRS